MVLELGLYGLVILRYSILNRVFLPGGSEIWPKVDGDPREESLRPGEVGLWPAVARPLASRARGQKGKTEHVVELLSVDTALPLKW